MATPKFAQPKPNFHAELKRRINDYFEQRGIDKTGNYKLFSKAVILVITLVALYVHLTFFTPTWGWALVECALLGITIAAIGFNIMHDGAHGSFSNNKMLNKLAAVTLGFLGGSHFMWDVKHNMIHHSYTNIEGVDDDIEAQPFLRMANGQKRYKIHRLQHLYFWMLYSILYIYWIFLSDYRKYFKQRIGSTPLKKMQLKDHIYFWFYKVLHHVIFIVLPMFTVGVLPTIVGFLVCTLVAGFVLSIVFQLAHTVEHTHFPMPDEVSGKMDDEWAIHQLKTTANFATSNRLVSWFVGGLNFQIEHHLFPKISHVHYPAISKIIKKACEEYGIAYIEYKRTHQAVLSHILFLRKMGRA